MLFKRPVLYRITGGACTGGDKLKAYEFIAKYGIADDTCAPFAGLNYVHGFSVADMMSVPQVQDHMCYSCDCTEALLDGTSRALTS